MAIESKVYEGKKQEEYLKLMISKNGEIVLFSEPSTGTVVYGSGENGFDCIGYHTDDWLMGQFTDYHGPVTLSNK